MTDLVAIARSLFVKGKGILAADESVHTATARLASYGIAAGAETRRQYRDLFLGANDIEKYKKQGAIFTKWRAVIKIDGDNLPSAQAIHENAKRLASYAKEAQMAGLVPVLETDVLHEGKHSRQRARAVIEETLRVLSSVLAEHSVDRASLVLKTSIALSGSENAKKDTPEEVAR